MRYPQNLRIPWAHKALSTSGWCAALSVYALVVFGCSLDLPAVTQGDAGGAGGAGGGSDAAVEDAGLDAGSCENTVQAIFDDMHLPHQGYPYGMPSSYDIYEGPVLRSIGSGESDFYVLVPGGLVYEEIGRSSSTNTRVQIRNLRGYVLDKSDNTWKPLPGVPIEYGNSAGDLSGSPTTATDLRQEPDGISARLLSGSTDAFQFNAERIDIHAIYQKDLLELATHVFTTYEARLILDDEQGADDRHLARYVADADCTVWKRIDSVWEPDFSENHDLGFGRFKYVTNDWQCFNFVTDISLSDLQQNPPPL